MSLSTNTIPIESLEATILRSLTSYIKGRADEIVARHTKEAVEEINLAVRDEVARTVLTIGKTVDIEYMRNKILITIRDDRKEKK